MSQVETILAHYGIRGMKWGIRRSNPGGSDGDSAVQVKVVPGKGVKTSGGKGLPATEDAIKTAIAIQKAKKSGVSSLSSTEMQTAVKRMELEDKFTTKANAVPPKVQGTGAKFVKSLIGLGKKTDAAVLFGNSPTGKLLAKKIDDAKNPKEDTSTDTKKKASTVPFKVNQSKVKISKLSTSGSGVART